MDVLLVFQLVIAAELIVGFLVLVLLYKVHWINRHVQRLFLAVFPAAALLLTIVRPGLVELGVSDYLVFGCLLALFATSGIALLFAVTRVIDEGGRLRKEANFKLTLMGIDRSKE